MPLPPSNPLTMLRKLGTTLVGRDGLLTDAASTALGYSPMDRVKTRLAAQSEVQKQIDFKTKMDADARKAEADQLSLAQSRFNLDKGQYDLGRSKITDARSDAERLAAAQALNPNAPTPEDALGAAAGKRTAFDLERANPNTTIPLDFPPDLAQAIGVKPGGTIDDKTLQMLMTARNVDEATKARLQAAREAAASRADTRRAMSDTRALNTFLDEQNRVAQSPQIRASQQILASAMDTKAQVDNYKQAVQSGDSANANQILAEVITVAFAKVRDPNSVVREGEVTRLLAQWGLADRAGNWLGKQIDGGVLPPDALLKLQHALEVDADTSYKIIKGEQDRLSQMQQAGSIPSYYGRDFTFGYMPTTLPSPDPGAPPAPGVAPPGSAMDNLRKRFPLPTAATPAPRRY